MVRGRRGRIVAVVHARRVLAVAGLVGLVGVACTQDEPVGSDTPAVETDLAERPVVQPPTGEPDGSLQVIDLVVGEGEAPGEGDLVATRYVGVGLASGTEFDASWDRGEPLRFRAGTGEVIAGWDVALLGDPDRGVEPMRIGGRRRVVVPPDLAYGEALLPGLSDPQDTTLVFVIDLVAVG